MTDGRDGRRALRPAGDDRALGLGIIVFAAALVIGALLFTLLDPAATQVFDISSDMAEHSQATAEIDEAQQIWGLILFWVAFVAIIGLIARAVAEGGQP